MKLWRKFNKTKKVSNIYRRKALKGRKIAVFSFNLLRKSSIVDIEYSNFSKPKLRFPWRQYFPMCNITDNFLMKVKPNFKSIQMN